MWTQRDIIIFLAGFETFNTLTHTLIGMSGILPMRFYFVMLTPGLNTSLIIINAIITLWLFWVAQRLK